jgi:hypothetical protein
MKTESDHNELLSDVLSENAPADFRNTSLQRTLASARQHRRARMVLRTSAAAAICVALVAAILWQRNDSTNIAVKGGPSAPAVQTIPGTSIQLVSDDELLAMFPDRPVALVGPPGNRQFVFLDEQRAHADAAMRHKGQL